MDCPKRSTRYVPSRKPARHPRQSPENTHHGALAEHPGEQPERLGADRADGPHHRRRSSTANRMVFTAMRKPIRTPASTVRLKLCVAFSNTGRLVRPGRAGRCDAGDDAVDAGRDLSARSRQHERGGGVTGRAEQARGDVHDGASST